MFQFDGSFSILLAATKSAAGTVWPGAMSRARRNRFIERWAGRNWALRPHRAEAFASVVEVRKTGDAEEAPLSMGQDAGLIHDIRPAGEIVRRIAAEAETILSTRLASLLR